MVASVGAADVGVTAVDGGGPYCGHRRVRGGGYRHPVDSLVIVFFSKSDGCRVLLVERYNIVALYRISQ